jgi:hypothetical protein
MTIDVYSLLGYLYDAPFVPLINNGNMVFEFFRRFIVGSCHSIRPQGDLMAEDKGKAEEAAEKTGQLVGKGLKKGFGVAKAFGKGAKDAVDKKEEKK